MKRLYLVLVIVLLVLVGGWIGYLFLVDESSEFFDDEGFDDEYVADDEYEYEIGNLDGEGFDGDSGGGDSGGGDSGGGAGDAGVDDDQSCTMKQVPYSLRNFEESVVCLERDGDDCVSLVANCSVDVYNLDGDFSGDFEIKYTLLDSSRNELEAKTLSKNVVAGGYEMFLLDFARSDAGGIDEDSSCFFSIVGIPLKESCA